MTAVIRNGPTEMVVAGGDGAAVFFARNPKTGENLEPPYCSASAQQVDEAGELAQRTTTAMAASSGKQRAALLRSIAEKLVEAQQPIIECAHQETGLPLARLNGEMGRTVGQLRLFADLVEEGSWVEARIDEAQPERKPAPRPSVRSMLRPLGPVAVFGASNFPLAFSVAGGDTAAALAAGCPVLVKAHPAHPGTSELVGRAICEAMNELGWPAGVFSLLFDAGVEVGTALVQHPAVKAVAFTGSTTGGQALMRLTAGRPEPIPCFAEMGSVNPVFVLPSAMQARAESIAGGLATSFTLGSGQFCTKPGAVFVPSDAPESFWQRLHSAVNAMEPMGMLTGAIAARFEHGIAERRKASGTVELLAEATAHLETAHSEGGMQRAANPGAVAQATVFRVTLENFLAQPEMGEEIFGPTMVVVTYDDPDRLAEAARRMHGQLTATVQGEKEDERLASGLLAVLETRAGRLVWNGYPTGVEVCHAMVHGGPFPATSDSRFTSVGTASILRFARPVCFQDVPEKLLPPELQEANPLGMERMVNGQRCRH